LEEKHAEEISEEHISPDRDRIRAVGKASDY